MDACHQLASKGRFYEQSVRVPLLMKYDGVIAPGLVDDEHLVSSGLDILPTLCDYAGVAVPKTLMGGSLRPIAERKHVGDWRQYVVSENHTGRMIRSERFKYCVYNEGTARESLVHTLDLLPPDRTSGQTHRTDPRRLAAERTGERNADPIHKRSRRHGRVSPVGIKRAFL